MKHVVLVKIIGNTLTKVQYLESKFDREPGDVMVYDGERMDVAIVGNDKDSVISAINEVIKEQNRVNRKSQKKSNKKVDKLFNDIMRDAIKMINL
jgi:hypothetical protein